MTRNEQLERYSNDEYTNYLQRKLIAAESVGFKPKRLPKMLFDWQKNVVTWACELGRAAIFADCGLGKTFMQLAWADQVAKQTGYPVLILCPLAVGQQTIKEAEKLGIKKIKRVHELDDIDSTSIHVCNYERVLSWASSGEFDPSNFSGIVLDESSKIKNETGKTRKMLTDIFSATPYRLACTATPSPNDHKELASQCEFLGVMTYLEMLAHWFVNDTANTGDWRLKGHARKDFWRWLRTWAACIGKPSDVGGDDTGYKLPEHIITEHVVEIDQTENANDGELFRIADMSSTGIHKEGRMTVSARARKVKQYVDSLPLDQPVVIWTFTNYENEAIHAAFGEGQVKEISGNTKDDKKEKLLVGFSEGEFRILMTKPSIAGFGLNWQHCCHQVFVGVNYSFEMFYQATKRLHRFGQKNAVNTAVFLAETEHNIISKVKEKQAAHEEMIAEMTSGIDTFSVLSAQQKGLGEGISSVQRGDRYTIYNADCVEAMKEIESNSIDMHIFSPPFASLFTYSSSLRDLGNCKDSESFWHGMGFVIEQLHRILRPGRMCCVHVMDLPLLKWRDGHAGLYPFHCDTIFNFQKHGFVYAQMVTIWKDPVVQMQRTKEHALFYKTLRKNSTQSRPGSPDYLIIFRKLAENPDDIVAVPHTKEEFTLDEWQEIASPVWWTVNQGRVLNGKQAREQEDERHICPLQLDVIDRALHLYSSPGETIFSPFAGIGSEGVQSLKKGRKFIGAELKESYWKQACRFLEQIESEEMAQQTIDLFGVS